jgi:hypothetical protein
MAAEWCIIRRCVGFIIRLAFNPDYERGWAWAITDRRNTVMGLVREGKKQLPR